MSRPEYFTAEEFTSLVLQIAKDEGYISEPESYPWHPQDLVDQLEPIMHTVSATVQHVMAKQRAAGQS